MSGIQSACESPFDRGRRRRRWDHRALDGLRAKRRGVEFVCFEAAAPGSGQSAGRTRVFRHGHDDERLVRLAVRARAEWERLEGELGVRLLGREGVLICGPNVAERAAAFEAAGVPARLVGRGEQVEALPVFEPPEDEALLDELGGSIDVGPPSRARRRPRRPARGRARVRGARARRRRRAAHLRGHLVRRAGDHVSRRPAARADRRARPGHPAHDRAPHARGLPRARAGRAARLPPGPLERARRDGLRRADARWSRNTRSASAGSSSRRWTRRSPG